MGQNDVEIYESLRFEKFSQGCEGQAYGGKYSTDSKGY